MTTLDVLTFNLNNPSRDRAQRQLEFLAARPEHVLVLTETADSAGCDLLASRFAVAGYEVTFPRPGRGERGVMVVSRLATRPDPGLVMGYLPHRAVSVTVDTDEGPLDIIGIYVPSRDATRTKTIRKSRFLDACRAALPKGEGLRAVIGDFNILEPSHTPRYRFFQQFEYDFYAWLGESGYLDAFRALHPDALEYSWVGRTGDGYRYDHVHASPGLATALISCAYVHEVRTADPRLTDHSALTVSFALRATAPLLVSTPAARAAALF
ncbi:endonuclease/exonuclease/phosphatase [Streptomyces sp. NPDC004629]|uniref:endonuclease/exonuclease/phosphatase n=1 Tax=Streptomyces sp. NPDC004629 TaxID=3364705 RepID=UPI0036ABADF0